MKLTAEISYEKVKEAYEKEKSGRIKQRLFIILKTFKIKSSYKIAEIADTSHTKVQRWINRFNKYGFDGLKDKARTGAPTKLNAEQKIKLENVLDNPGEFRAGYNSVEVLSKIKNIFGTDYTLRHVRRLLKSLDYSRIKPRPTHINKDTIKAKDTVKKLKKNSAVWIKNGSHLQEMSSA